MSVRILGIYKCCSPSLRAGLLGGHTLIMMHIPYYFERAKRAHSLFMSIEISDIYIYIGIYVRVVRVSCVPSSPYTKETPLGIVL